MLAHKLNPQAFLPSLWPKTRPVSSVSRPLTERPLRQTPLPTTFNYKFSIKRTYFAATGRTTRRTPKSTTAGSMLSVATTAAALIGGSAAYSTSASASDSSSSASAPQPSTTFLESAAYQIPHPEKKHKGGEDTFMVSSNGLVIGVFDGVGGWASSGIDPRDYAVKLSLAAQEATDQKGYIDPVHVMKYAAAIAKKVVGSATACIVSLESAELTAANLGDSGFLIVRPNKDNKSVQLVFKSEEQQHAFNFPYQLGASSSDRPEDSDVYKLPVEEGDLVILGTDGLFDNIDEKYICRLVAAAIAGTEGGSQSLKIASLARFIAAEAFKVSQDPNAQTPFEIASRRRYRGGKPDDITVLVSRVRANTHQTDSSNTATDDLSSTGTNSNPAQHKKAGNADKFSADTLDSDLQLNPTSASDDYHVSDPQPNFLQRLFGLRPWTTSHARL